MKSIRNKPGVVRGRGRIRQRRATRSGIFHDFILSGTLGFVATFVAIERSRGFPKDWVGEKP